MPDTPYGVTGCRCRRQHSPRQELIGGDTYRWTANPHCPYHGILPRDRTDTGVYRVVRGDDGKPTELKPVEGRVVAAWDADGEQVYEVALEDPDSLDNRLRRGIEQAERGETVDRGDFTHDDTPDCETCQQYGECLDCQQAREDREDRIADAAAGNLHYQVKMCCCLACPCPFCGCHSSCSGDDDDWMDCECDCAASYFCSCGGGVPWPCPVAKGPRCKGAGYCVYHDVPTVHDTGPFVAQADDGAGPVGHTDMAALNRQYREKYGAFSKKPAWWRRLFRR